MPFCMFQLLMNVISRNRCSVISIHDEFDHSWQPESVLSINTLFRLYDNEKYSNKLNVTNMQIFGTDMSLGCSWIIACRCCSNYILASIYWAKPTKRRDEKHLGFGIWCGLYWRFDGKSHIVQSISCRFAYAKLGEVESGITIIKCFCLSVK